MKTAKAEVALMLAALPDDSCLEDIQYHLFVLKKIRTSRLRGRHFPSGREGAPR